MPARLPHLVFGLYLLIVLAALVWPGPLWAGKRIEPFVLGLPFAFAWFAGWAALTFVALSLYHKAVGGGRE